ncbi:unnamed protein product [Hermetia illucens]|uniref:PiggyBac transposable element-derived protein domain-containing protein n=1 Tax=Hermetia illucens TaxID=343691 RepID=A0A7R8UXI0_HERIL|nr:unnamed protein product [Hermetia illucens]
MSSGKKKLTDEEVREMIEDSDDEDFSDGSDEEFVPSGEELEDWEMEDVIEDIEYDRNYVCESQPNENDRNRASSSPSESTDEESDPVRGSPHQLPFEQQENLIWLSDVLALGRENFSGNPGVRNIEEILDEDRKVNIIKIFEYFLDDSLIEEMVTHTNNYAQTYQNVRSGLHSRMKRWKPVDKGDLKKLFGIIMFMGVKILPSIEHYWKLDILYYCPLMHSIQMSYNRQKDNYITVLKWHDKCDVLMISTCHGDEMTRVRTRLGETLKPNAVIDYNDAKKGIDVADQLSSYHSPLHKSLTWFKKVAVDLLFRVAVVNARCIYNEYSTGAPLTMLEVQKQIIRHLLGPSANVTTPARPPSQGLSTHKLTEIPRRNNMLVHKLLHKITQGRNAGCLESQASAYGMYSVPESFLFRLLQ